MRKVRRTLWILLTGIALMSVPLRAQAEESGVSSRGGWYGWQTLIVTGVSHSLIATTPFTGYYSGIGVGGGLLLGGPIVHFAHGNVAKGFLSLGINAAGGLAGGGIGFAAGIPWAGREGEGMVYGALIGSLVGFTAANIIDATLLAYDRGGSAGYGMTSKPRSTLSLVPTADIRPGRASLGVMGTF